MIKNSFADMTPELMEGMLSQFLINSWSYSKVTSFARHEKVFEMNYIYGMFSKKSASAVAGNAYHKALQYYFAQLKEGVEVDLASIEQTAYLYIDEQPANIWKLQTTTPTIEACLQTAYKNVTEALRNFMGEIDVYLNDISEVLDVEVYGSEWVVVNGVEVPLPLNFQIDLVVRNKEGNVVVYDHKLKKSFTSEDELALGIGIQAISYVLGYEAKTGLKVDQVSFVENKSSKNKDGSPQLSKYTVQVDDDTRSLYEALLYEPLQRTIKAVRDPDYVYLMNPNDNFIDLAEIHSFWSRTQLAEISVDDFNVDESKKEMVSKRLKKIRDASITTVSPNVLKNFRENASKFIKYDLSTTNMTEEQKIEHVLRSFGTIVEVAHKFEGYSSDTFLLRVNAGVKISSIYNKRLDIANQLNVSNVRISEELVVYEGKSYLAIDFSKKRDRDLIFDKKYVNGLKLPIGMDNYGNVVHWDLQNHSTPHAIVCGATGSGKSVCIKSVIHYAIEAKVDNIIILDPKFEFKEFAKHKNVEVINNVFEIEIKMLELVDKMNEMVENGKHEYTLVIFDEYADAMDQSRTGVDLKRYENIQVGMTAKGLTKTKRECVGEDKNLNDNFKMMLQKGRSCGFRFMASTQRASVKVIPGDLKVNLPVQICFFVPKAVDSKVVLDELGAESLSGRGDGLMKSPEFPNTIRFQAFYKP